MSGHPMCDDIHIFACTHGLFYMLFECIFTGRKLSTSVAFSKCQFAVQLVNKWYLHSLFDESRKGEPRTLQQQFELRLYTDHPLTPVSQIFPNLWFLIIWRLTSCQFPKRTKWIPIQSKYVQREESCKLFGGTFSHISCTRINLCEFLVAMVVAHSIHSSLIFFICGC